MMEFPLDIIYKNSTLIEAFSQKDFKFDPSKKQQGFGINFALVLLTPIHSSLGRKRNCIKNLVVAPGPGCGKIIFTLLKEVIKIHIRLTFIDFSGPRFENPLWEVFRDSSILVTSKKSDF